jgi:hypothetical protein
MNRTSCLLFVATALSIGMLAASCGLAGPSGRARTREQELLHLPIRSLALAGVKLVDETSDPGRPHGSGSADEGRNVEVVRIYRYSGAPVDVCEAFQRRFESLGWTLAQPLDCARPGLVAGRAALSCTRFEVQAFLGVTGVVSKHDTPRRLTVRLVAPYPQDDDVSTTDTAVSSC